MCIVRGDFDPRSERSKVAFFVLAVLRPLEGHLAPIMYVSPFFSCLTGLRRSNAA